MPFHVVFYWLVSRCRS